jgi:hypothetical protein
MHLKKSLFQWVVLLCVSRHMFDLLWTC